MGPRILQTILAILLFTVCAGHTLAGSVSGTIKYSGQVPTLRPIKMDADPACAKKHGDSPPKSEILVLGDGNTMGNIFVFVSQGLPDKAYPAPSTPVVLEQDGCRYVPHVMGIMVGQELKILNSDGLLHNVHAWPRVNPQFNQAMPESVAEAVKSFGKAEPMFKIKCDIHPWMAAYIAVLEHPFFDVTGADGRFTIDGLLAGTYVLEAWHEKLGTQTSSVTIRGDEMQTADFSFSPPKRP